MSTAPKWVVFFAGQEMPQVVFLLHGAAMAGGLGMACAADQVIAVMTRMALTETAIGIVPPKSCRMWSIGGRV